jgi:hypothetical protein
MTADDDDRRGWIHMPQERYVAALERQRARIAEGLELVYWDSRVIGEKETQCSWGLCSTDKEAWPDAQDHLWPDHFLEHGRVAPLYLVRGQLCPFDTDQTPRGHLRDLGDPRGCYFRCRFFQAKTIGPAPDRKRALELYDDRLAEVRPK